MTRKYGGSGLGFTICKDIVKGLGGKIWLRSKECDGFIFYFSTPLENNEQTSCWWQWRHYKALTELLESERYDVTSANNGMDALGLILKETFDVIILDLTMSEFNGLDVIQRLKDSGDLEKNKVILLAAVSVFVQKI